MPDEPAEGPKENVRGPISGEARTSIDTLLELVKSRGKTELTSAAVSLNVDPRIIENWAKVLESGGLIHITYEVGKMYLEPITIGVEQQKDLKLKTDFTKFILEEDLAVERISLDKFSKNISDLNASITGIEKLYQQKIPEVQRILAEVDKAYSPIEAKKRSMEKIKIEAEADFKEINKKADSLYAKINSFSPKQTDSNVNEKLGQLNKILENISDAEMAINEMEKNENKFFKNMEIEIDARTKEFKKQLAASKSTNEQTLRANARQLGELIKGVKDQANTAHQLSKEVDNFRKEFESAKHDLDVLRNDFADRYEKVRESIEKDSKLVESESKRVTDAVASIRQGFGDIAKFDEEIKKWRKNMNEMSREVTATRTDIIKLTNQLNALESNKSSVESKAKIMDDLSKEGKKTKDKTGKIRKMIKDTADEIKESAEGKK
jgi:chromosome segregation ATPase